MRECAAAAQAASARILLADDEAAFRFAAVVALRGRGYRVEEAADGKEAFRKILEARNAGAPFRLLITDIRMPGMSGIELIKGLRAEGVEIVLCAITCFGDQSLVEELSEIGCTEYIEKPFPPDELITRLGGILEKLDG